MFLNLKKIQAHLGMPAWNQGAARNSPSSEAMAAATEEAAAARLSTLSGRGGGVVVVELSPGPPSELLHELICEILFDLKSFTSLEVCELRLKLKKKSDYLLYLSYVETF